MAIPDGFQVNKGFAMSSGQLSQVRNLNTILEKFFINLQAFVIMLSGKYSLQICFWKNDLGLTSKF